MTALALSVIGITFGLYSLTVRSGLVGKGVGAVLVVHGLVLGSPDPNATALWMMPLWGLVALCFAFGAGTRHRGSR